MAGFSVVTETAVGIPRKHSFPAVWRGGFFLVMGIAAGIPRHRNTDKACRDSARDAPR